MAEKSKKVSPKGNDSKYRSSMFVKPVLNRKSTTPHMSLVGNARLSISSVNSGLSGLGGFQGDEHTKAQLCDPESPTILNNTLANPNFRPSIGAKGHRPSNSSRGTPMDPNFDFEIMGRELKLPDVKRKNKIGNPTKNIGIGSGSYRRKSTQFDPPRDSNRSFRSEDLRNLVQAMDDQSALPIEETPPGDALPAQVDCISDFGESQESSESPIPDTPGRRGGGYATVN